MPFFVFFLLGDELFLATGRTISLLEYPIFDALLVVEMLAAQLHDLIVILYSLLAHGTHNSFLVFFAENIVISAIFYLFRTNQNLWTLKLRAILQALPSKHPILLFELVKWLLCVLFSVENSRVLLEPLFRSLLPHLLWSAFQSQN